MHSVLCYWDELDDFAMCVVAIELVRVGNLKPSLVGRIDSVRTFTNEVSVVRLVIAHQTGTLEYELQSGLIYAVFEGRPGTPGKDMPNAGMQLLKEGTDYVTYNHEISLELKLKREASFPISVLLGV